VKFDLELIKVLGATGLGTGNILLDIDVVLKVLISFLSLLYVGKKVYDLYKNDK
tara:strand:+ start:5075 stop:5236 length:162 start_codon:yes stop_codon:yes gene_type:complete